jgi:hypothetical protein
MIDNLIAGIVGIGMLSAFLGIMLVWVPAPPLIIIVAVVMSLLLVDFVRSLRNGNGSSR